MTTNNVSNIEQNVTTTPVDSQPALVTPLKENQTLRDSVEYALRNYFAHLDGQPAADLYQMVLSEVEAPLLEVVMDYANQNQTKASQLLGLNRGTLRKKLKQYGLL